MVFQLSNIKVCWTDKMTVLFQPPFANQTATHKVYNMYLQRPRAEDDQSLLQWLRWHQTSTSKPKPYADNRVLVGVKYVSMFNPIFFYQHLTMNHPHRNVQNLHHPDASTMPLTVAYFTQSAALTPQYWNTSDATTAFFEKAGHKDYFINTVVSYVHSLWHLASLANWGRHCRHHRCILHICGEALPTIASSKCHIHWHYCCSFCTQMHPRPPSVIHSKHCHLGEISSTLGKAGHCEITSSYPSHRSRHSYWHVRPRSSSRGRVRKISRFHTRLTSHSATGQRDAKRDSPVP